jgi:hypothetical protein
MDISNFSFSYLKPKLSGINWNIGSTVRELIAQPVVTATEASIEAFNTQTNALSIQTYKENPEEYEDKINEVFEDLGLQTNNIVNSTGTVAILTHSDTPATVYQNTVFYYKDHVVTVMKDIYPSFVKTDKEGFSQLREIGFKSYMFEVPVQASTTNTYLSEGTPLTWSEAPEDIYDVVITSPVSGGRMDMSLSEKVSSIQDYVAPNAITLNDGIAKQLRQALPDTVVDAKYATDITDSAISYLYVKTAKAPGFYHVNVTGNKQESGLYQVQLKSYGLMLLHNAYKDGIKIPIHQVQINNNELYCLLEYKGGLTENFELQLYGMQDATKVQDYINGYTLGSPFNIEVKAPSVFNLYLDFNYTGNRLTETMIAEICSNIQFYGLDMMPTDSALQSMLSQYGATLVGSATYTLTDIDGSAYKQKYAPAIYSSKFSSYAIYSSVDKVNANYV